MAGTKRIANVGASARASDIQKISDVAAAADDRATEILCTPGSNLKTVMPLSEESATVNPRMLVVGQDTDATVPNGKVRVRPSQFRAGSDAYTIALAAALKANADSPTIGNNSSGSTRTDLLYAVIDYGTTTTETVRQKPTSGSTPVSVSLTTQKDMLVTIAVIANVAAGDPLASLPADDTVNGVYNFGLASLAIPNGFAGGAINQSVITPLWTGGWAQTQRVRGFRLGSILFGSASERPGGVLQTMSQNAERWGSGVERWFIPFKHLPSTSNVAGSGPVLDNTINWNNRFLRMQLYYLGGASNFPLETWGGNAGGSFSGDFTLGWLTGNSGASILLPAYSGTAQIGLQVASNALTFYRFGNPADAVNGDALLLYVEATDRLLATV